MYGDIIYGDPWTTGYPPRRGHNEGNLFMSSGDFHGERPFPFWENPAVYFPPANPQKVSSRKKTRRAPKDKQMLDDTRVPLQHNARENPFSRHEGTKPKGDTKQTRSSRPKKTQDEWNIPIEYQPQEETVTTNDSSEEAWREDHCDATNALITDNEEQTAGETAKTSGEHRCIPVTTEDESAKESRPVVDNQDDSPPEIQTANEQKLAAIKNELVRATELISRVVAFKGTRKDKEFLYLEEYLTRCLLGLDLIETDGQENVKCARRAAVKYIYSILNDLEDRVSES